MRTKCQHDLLLLPFLVCYNFRLVCAMATLFQFTIFISREKRASIWKGLVLLVVLFRVPAGSQRPATRTGPTVAGTTSVLDCYFSNFGD